MKMKDFLKYSVVPFLTVVFVFLYFRHLSPFIYQTNDDLFLKTIVSGEVTGTPQPHLLYMGYLSGLLLSALYRLFPNLPWYGLFLCFSIGISMFLILYKLLKTEKSFLSRFFTWGAFLFVSYGFLFLHIAELQYTTIAGIVGSCGLFLLFFASPRESLRDTLWEFIDFFLLSVYSMSIRNKSFLMLLPFIGMIFLGKYLDAWDVSADRSEKTSFKAFFSSRQKNLLCMAGIFCVLLLFVAGTERLAYSREDWHDFRIYNSHRETIYDYNGYPDYENNKALYQELGISPASYEAAYHHYSILPEPAIQKDSMEILAEVSRKEQAAAAPSFSGRLREMASFFLDRHLSYTDRPLNLLVYCLYFLVFLSALFSHKKRAIRDILFLLTARMFVWCYLMYFGRFPARVSQICYFAELAVLLAILFSRRLWEISETLSQRSRRENLCRIWQGVSLVIIILISIRFGFPKAEAAAWEASSRLSFSQSYAELQEYFADHPEQFYYLDMNSFGSFTEDALKGGKAACANYVLMGSWLPKSPWYNDKLSKAGITDAGAALYENPDVYVVFMDSENTSFDYLADFYAENHPGVLLEVVDTVSTSNDIKFLIIKGVAP